MHTRLPSQSPQYPQIIGSVLAGGRSRRMGKDKRYLSFNGKPMVEHATELLRGLGLHSVVVSSQDLLDSIHDIYPDAGPVSGMLSVVKHCQQPMVKGFLFIPVDMPKLTPEVLHRILQSGIESSVPVCFEEHYLPVYLPNSDNLLFQLQQVLQQRNGSVRQLLEETSANLLPMAQQYEQQKVFKNLNNPQDWLSFIQASEARR